MADTLRDICLSWTRKVAKVSDTPALDVRLIAMHILGLTQTQFMLSDSAILSDDQKSCLEEALSKRCEGQPVAYITGERSFYNDVFSVRPGVLVPRADTEILVDAAVDHVRRTCKGRCATIIDVCAGTGCVGISVAKAVLDVVPSVELYLTDIDDTAFCVFSENAKRLLANLPVRVHLLKGDLLETVAGLKADIIVSNPPYIRSQEIPSLDISVRCEPLLALDGGEDGMDIIRRLSHDAKSCLVDGGMLAMETGFDQVLETQRLLKGLGFVETAVLKDLGGNYRVAKGLVRQ